VLNDFPYAEIARGIEDQATRYGDTAVLLSSLGGRLGGRGGATAIEASGEG